MKGHLRSTSGFTLIELAVVLLVIAAIMGGAIALTSAGLHGLSYQGTQNKLKILQQALADYRIAYNKLPCPAHSYNYVPTDNNFGVAATGATCGSAPATELPGTAAVGMIPVRTLGLPDEMAFDAWGRRIRYAVFADYVQENAFDTNDISDTDGLEIYNDETNEALEKKALFVIISYGENGHGGRGNTTGTLINARSINAHEYLNCKCDDDGVEDGAVNQARFAYGSENPDPSNLLNNYDDVVVFSTRVDLMDADE